MHHEMSAAQHALHLILEEAAKRGLKKVKSVRVIVGQTRALEEDYFNRAFEEASKGTLASGAKIIFSISPLKAVCSSCHKEITPASSLSLSCPFCAGTDIEIVSGQELLVGDVE